jgi:hypothetical protein
MKIISRAWNNFKIQPDIWFFYGFLAAFTLSIRKVLFFYPIEGKFNEWSGAYIYLSDIFLTLALLIWIINILCNYYTNLSISNTILWLKKGYIFLPLLLVSWSFISIFWSVSQYIALFKAIKLFEMYLLYLYIICRVISLQKECSTPERMFHPRKNVPRGTLYEAGVEHFGFLQSRTFIKQTFQIIISLGFIQAMIGIIQFILQYSIGLFWLKESIISPSIDGVAKIVFHGEKFIRSYGLFPHPNILGGFLLVSIILTWVYSKVFHICHPELDSGYNLRRFQIPCLPAGRKSGMTTLLFIQLIGLILTFSKSAIIGLLVTIGYIYWKNKRMGNDVRNVPRGTFPKIEVKQFIISLLIFILLTYIGIKLTDLNLSDNLSKSSGDRVWQLIVSRETILDHFWFGLGQGQYVANLANVSRGTLAYWQYQPIHNVFLLILSELGFVGLFIFIHFLWELFRPDRNVPRGTFYGAGVEQNIISRPELTLSKQGGLRDLIGLDPLPVQKAGSITLKMTNIVFRGILLGLTFIMIFDHYLWDIQQGQIILWILLGLAVGLDFMRKRY